MQVPQAFTAEEEMTGKERLLRSESSLQTRQKFSLMQYLDFLSDLILFSSLSHVRKGFKKLKILSHNSQILSTSVFVKTFHPDISKT
jgi:hypothetical protein